MIDFPGVESAKRRGAMPSEEITPHWDRIFGKKLTWLELRKIKEAWL